MLVLSSLKIEAQWSEPMSFTIYSALGNLIHTEHSICSDHLAKQFQRRRLLEIGQSEKNNCLWRPCLSTDRDEMYNLYRRPSIVASYQVSVHLAKQFEKRRFFLNRPIRNKNYLWRPCLLTNRDEMNNLYRRPSIVASYQVSVHLAKNY